MEVKKEPYRGSAGHTPECSEAWLRDKKCECLFYSVADQLAKIKLELGRVVDESDSSVYRLRAQNAFNEAFANTACEPPSLSESRCRKPKLRRMVVRKAEG